MLDTKLLSKKGPSRRKQSQWSCPRGHTQDDFVHELR